MIQNQSLKTLWLFIACCCMGIVALAQTIRGVVVNDNEEPLPGVTIQLGSLGVFHYR